MKKYMSRDPAFEGSSIKRYMLEHIRMKEQSNRVGESRKHPLDILAFGSFNQFRDLVAQKSSSALALVKDIDGNNMMMLAAMAGKLDYVKFLYDKKGFDINAVNKQGSTALHLAMAYGNNEVANFLIRKKAKQNMQNNRSKTPWEVAIKN